MNSIMPARSSRKSMYRRNRKNFANTSLSLVV